MHPKFRARPTLLVVCLALSLVACSPKSEEDLLASSEKFVTKGETGAALIELKNTLQRFPDSTRARLMLAQQLLATQDPRSAEIELRKLLEQKFDGKVVLPLLARSVLEGRGGAAAQKEFKTLRTGAAGPDAEILTQLARAEQQLGQLAEAEGTLKEALKLDPNQLTARILLARLTSGRAPDESLQTVAEVLRANPKQQDAWLLQGDVKLYMKRDIPGATEAYQRLIELRKDHALAYAALLSIRLMQKDAKGTEQLLTQSRKALPKHPQQHYFQAQLLALNGDLKGARESVQKLLSINPDMPKGQLLAGSLALQTGDLLQARQHLRKAVQLAPDLPDGLRLMAQLQIRFNQADQALQTLQPLLNASTPDSTTLAIAAQAHLQLGEPAKAEVLFAQAAKVAPNDFNIRTSLATTQLERGSNTDSALAELRDIAASDKDIVADLALVTAQIGRKNFEAALAAVDNIERKQPKVPQPHELRGRVNLARGDQAAARASFEKALAVEPRYYPAVVALAKLDYQDKQPQLAIARFEKLLTADPSNVQAMLVIAEQRTQAGENTAEVEALVDKAVKLSPEDPKPRQLQIALLLAKKDGKRALAAAQSAVVAIPSNPDLIDLLGRTEMETGAHNQAIASFNKVIALQPKSPVPHIRIADAYLLVGQPKAAMDSLKRALELAPQMLVPRKNLIALQRRAGQYKAALENAKLVQAQAPKNALGHLYEGDILYDQKDFGGAAKAYQSAIGLADDSAAAPRWHTALVSGKRIADAEKMSTAWLSGHPDDTTFMQYLGDFWLAAGRPQTAEKLYKDILKKSPQDSLALNNLAWALMNQKQPNLVTPALEAARKAAELSPKSPAVLETWASALAEAGDLKQALTVAGQAHAMAPNEPLFELSLARIQLKAGEKEEAAQHLYKLQKLGTQFPQQQQVLELIRSIRN
jgi:putative PEP-CTERM system TPR-repeat lipoprotein